MDYIFTCTDCFSRVQDVISSIVDGVEEISFSVVRKL